MTDDDPQRRADLPPGFDGEEPYEDEYLEAYPDWWRRNITEFRRHGMREYRPPRFCDAELTTEVIADLERELSVRVRLRSVNPQDGNNWELLVDGVRVTTVGRHREAKGFTVYEINSDEFVELVRSSVETE